MKLNAFLFFATFVFIFQCQLLAQTVVLDSSYSTDGIVTHTVGSINDEIRAIVLQPDNKLVAVGLSYNVNPSLLCAIARYLPDGTLDTSFSADGKLIDTYGQLSCSYQTVAIQTDGKIVTAGYARDTISLMDNIGLARYNTNGTADSTFGVAGKVTTDYYGLNDNARGLVIQPDGKIVVAGGISVTQTFGNFGIVRYTTDGTLDTTFSNDGKFNFNFTLGANCTSIAMQTDGKFVLGGATAIASNIGNLAIARVNTDGTLDSAFGVNGKQTIATAFSMVAESIALQPDGKIVAAGYAIVNAPYYDFIVARFLANGILDSTFSNDGYEITSFGPYVDYGHAVVIQPDGKIIVAGATSNTGLQNDFALARYNNNGTLDGNFGINGKLVVPVSSGYETISALLMQPDGKLIAAGFSEQGGKRQFTVVRFITDLFLGMIDFEKGDNSLLIYPNPITEHAEMNYKLQKEETISLALFDMQGNLLKQFISNQNQPSGSYSFPITFGSEIAAGYYILRFSNATSNLGIRIIKK